MADTKVSAFAALGAAPASNDLIPVIDISDTSQGAGGTAKTMTPANLVAFDAELSALAGLTSAADRVPYFTGSGTASLATFTAAGRALVDDADAAAMLTTLGLENVTNTSDANKPVSTAQQTALDLKLNKTLAANTTITSTGFLLRFLPGETPIFVGPVPDIAGWNNYPGWHMAYEGAGGGITSSLLSAHDDVYPSTFNLFKARGTAAAPTAVANADVVGSIGFWAHDGVAAPSVYQAVVAINAEVVGAVSAGVVPVDLVVYTGAGGYLEAMRYKYTGALQYPATNTAGGTVGAQTINKVSGTVNFAAAAQTLVVTNSLVTADSIVPCTVMTNDATALIKSVVPAAGSFTIKLNAAATAETRVGFFVINQ